MVYSEGDFFEVLEHLRSTVRQYGFNEFDQIAAEELLGELKVHPRDTLKEYLEKFIWYLSVFEEGQIQKTQRIFEEILGKHSWNWSLRSDLPIDDARPNVESLVIVRDMTIYSSLAKLRKELILIAREIESQVPGSDPEQSNDDSNDFKP